MRFDPERHHRRSIRVPGYDYGQPGAYFVTILAQDRKCVFGMVRDRSVYLDEIGKMIEWEWLRLSLRFRYIEIKDFILMPNHLHGIIMISDIRRGTGANETNDSLSRIPRAPTQERFGAPVAGTIPTVLRSFKATTTRRYRQILKDPEARLWQRNYYEHVIRDEVDLARVQEYILDNPRRWQEDLENPAHAPGSL